MRPGWHRCRECQQRICVWWDQGSTSDTDFNRGNFYLEATLLPKILSIYVDEQFSPDGLETRELYLRLNSRYTRWFLAAGEFYLPYGSVS